MDNPGEIMRLCRLCLVKDQVNIPIFEEQGDIRQIFLKISSCLPVKVSREDKLPKKICDGCSSKLDLLYEFWTTSANAEKTLLSWLGQAGVKDVEETTNAVVQHIAKPSETQVKEEALEDGHATAQSTENAGLQNASYEEGSSAKDECEEPPPKRVRRTAAVKAQINIAPDSDDDEDDLDNSEPMTKIEDESEESDGEDKDPSYPDVPGTSADDDQPGPSGVGKDGVEAPNVENLLQGSASEIDANLGTNSKQQNPQGQSTSISVSKKQLVETKGKTSKKTQIKQFDKDIDSSVPAKQENLHHVNLGKNSNFIEASAHLTMGLNITQVMPKIEEEIKPKHSLEHAAGAIKEAIVEKITGNIENIKTNKEDIKKQCTRDQQEDFSITNIAEKPKLEAEATITCQFKDKLDVIENLSKTKLDSLVESKPTFFCEACCLSFNCIRRYWNHRNLLHSDHDFDCILCDKKFKKTSALLHHSKFKHDILNINIPETKNGIPLFYCEACGEGFRNIQNRVIHLREKHKEGYIFCPLCTHACSSLDDLGFHIKIHKTYYNTLFSCKLCNQNVFFLHMFVNHLYGHVVVTSMNKFQCKICCCKLSGLQEFISHMESHLLGTLTKYFCFLCNKVYFSNHKLKLHVQQFHTNLYLDHKQFLQLRSNVIEDGSSCYWCGKMVFRGKLVQHLKEHKTLSKLQLRKLITCKVCLKRVSSNLYTQHLKVHRILINKKMSIADLKIKCLKYFGKNNLAVKRSKLTCTKVFRKAFSEESNITSKNSNISTLFKVPHINISDDHKKSEKNELKTVEAPIVKTDVGHNVQTKKDVSTCASGKNIDKDKLKTVEAPKTTKEVLTSASREGVKANLTSISNKYNKPCQTLNTSSVLVSENKEATPFKIQTKIEQKSIENTLIRKENTKTETKEFSKKYKSKQVTPSDDRKLKSYETINKSAVKSLENKKATHIKIQDKNEQNSTTGILTKKEDIKLKTEESRDKKAANANDRKLTNSRTTNNSVKTSGIKGDSVKIQDKKEKQQTDAKLKTISETNKDKNIRRAPTINSSGNEGATSIKIQDKKEQLITKVESVKYKEVFECPGCQRKIPNSKVLTIHSVFCNKLTSDVIKKSIQSCPICFQNFTNLSSLKQHMFETHSQIFTSLALFTGDEGVEFIKYECGICKQIFNTEKNLEDHKKTHDFLASLKLDLQDNGKTDSKSKNEDSKLAQVKEAVPQQTNKSLTKEEEKNLSHLTSPAFKKQLEQTKRMLKINLLYYQKQKLEQQKQMKNIEGVKAKQELQKIQKELLNTFRTGEVNEVETFSKTNYKSQTSTEQDMRSRKLSRQSRSEIKSPTRSSSENKRRNERFLRRSRSSSRERISNRRSRSGSRDSTRTRASSRHSLAYLTQDSRSNSNDRLMKAVDKSREQSRGYEYYSSSSSATVNPKLSEEGGAYRCHKCATLFKNYREFIIHKDTHEDSSEDEEGYLTHLIPPPPPHIFEISKNSVQSSLQQSYRNSDDDYYKTAKDAYNINSFNEESSNFDTYRSSKRRNQHEKSSFTNAGPTFLQKSLGARQTSGISSFFQQPSSSYSYLQDTSGYNQSEHSIPNSAQFSTAYNHLQMGQYSQRFKCAICGQEFFAQQYLDYHNCPGPF